MSTQNPSYFMSPHHLRSHFGRHYAESRGHFLAAGREAGASLECHTLPNQRGAHGEPLALDTAWLGPEDAAAMLIVSSGVHGVEGLCGSGCQVAMLQDTSLLQRAAQRGIGLLLIHAVNPYGFSHLRRTNEDNIDLNRNFTPSGARVDNPTYADLHELLLPPQWPPAESSESALRHYQEQRGPAAFREAVTIGQTSHASGLFYAGTGPAWSNTTLRTILRQYGQSRQRVAWVDIHTGLGPFGHGEKIHGGPANDLHNLEQTRRLWGADVVAAWANASASRQVAGHALGALFDACPDATNLAIALEFGTRKGASLEPLRAEQWLHLHTDDADLAQRTTIKRAFRDAFYVEEDIWLSMVLGQARVALLQACHGLLAM